MKQQLNVLEYMRSIAPAPKEGFRKSKLSDWTDYWLTQYCTNIKQSTLNSYDSAVKLHINRVLGDIDLKDLNADDVQLFINSLTMGIGLDACMSPKTVKNIHGVLHKCLAVAVHIKLIAENPAEMTALPRLEKSEIQPLDSKELTAFLRAIKGHSKEKLFNVAVFTGLRQAELIGLTWDCIHFDEGYIHVYRQLVKQKGKGGSFVFTSLKNSKPRKIFPAETVMQMFREIKAENSFPKSQFVFTNESGNHYTHAAVYNSFKKIMKKIGYPDFTFHDLRHTYAMLSLKAGDDIKTLQENMGHHSAAFTLDVYGHCNDEMKRVSGGKMEQLISTVILPSEDE